MPSYLSLSIGPIAKTAERIDGQPDRIAVGWTRSPAPRKALRGLSQGTLSKIGGVLGAIWSAFIAES